MKRFYTLVSTQESPDGGYAVLLDGKSVKTVSRADLIAPNEAIANLVMQEWAAQSDVIVPDTMPLTQILNTKIDRVRTEREAMQSAVLKYLDTDLLCYFAAEPEALKTRQEELWQPWLDWFKKMFGTSLEITMSLQALSQDVAVYAAVQSYVSKLDEDCFVVLQLVTSLSGSLVLALAFVQGQIKAQDVLRAIFVEEDYRDEIYDSERYGPDPMIEKSRTAKRVDLEAAQNYLKALLL
jgi:chaperone required for assembly of F1-ATPase